MSTEPATLLPMSTGLATLLPTTAATSWVARVEQQSGALTTECPICYEAIDVLKTGRVEMSCQHTFHFKCLTSWFSSQEVGTCPMCRKEATELEDFGPSVSDDEEEEEDEDDDEVEEDEAEEGEIANIMDLEYPTRPSVATAFLLAGDLVRDWYAPYTISKVKGILEDWFINAVEQGGGEVDEEDKEDVENYRSAIAILARIIAQRQPVEEPTLREVGLESFAEVAAALAAERALTEVKRVVLNPEEDDEFGPEVA